MAPIVGEKGLKEWNHLELQLAKAINVGKVTDPTLDAKRLPLLNIFQDDRWQVRPDELEVLRPSIQLASNLVRVGMPYIASFLPPRDDMFEAGELYDERGERTNLCPAEITLKDNPSKTEVAAALESLENLAPYIRWQTNYEMLSVASGEDKEMGWMGITRLVDELRPWGYVPPEMIVAADEESIKKGLLHRPLILGIMGEYIDVLKSSPKSSEQRLRVTFMAAITIAHEVGHAIFHQDFRSYNPPTCEEPYVGNGCSKELGTAFITWIFGGFHPGISMPHGRSDMDFTAHAEWTEHYTMDIERRPLYKTIYSISVSYMEEKLSQSWWDGLPSAQQLIYFSSKAKEGLKPITTDTATARHPEWEWSWSYGPSWKYEYNFRKRGYRPGDDVEGLTEEEIAWAKANKPKGGKGAGAAFFFSSMSSLELKRAQKRNRGLISNDPGANEDEDEEDFPFVPVVPNGTDPARYGDRLELDIDDGIIEKDAIKEEDDSTSLERIIVTYLPEDESSAKRPRDNDNDDRQLAKRVKVGPASSAPAASGAEATQTEADKFLAASSPFTIASTMTRMDIHNLCVNRKIPGYSNVEPNEYWQQAHPDLDDGQQDLWVPVRLYNDMIDTALIHMFSEDLDAKIKLKQASLDSVMNWGFPQIRDFCRASGVSMKGTNDTTVVKKRVQDHKLAELEMLRAQSQSVSADGTPSPENWSLRDLQNFCEQHDVPSTGTKPSLILRVERYKRDLAGDFPRPRRPQIRRIDGAGFEVYSFQALLGSSTVSSLKSALFMAGGFPPEAVLTLYFKGEHNSPLRDDQPLRVYNNTLPDWTSLRLTVASKRKARPGDTFGTAIDIDAEPKVKFSTPIPLPGTTLADAIGIPGPIVTIGDEPTPADILAAARSDPAIQREAAVKLKNANPTFSELLTSIGNRAPRLDQMMLAGGKFQTMRQPQGTEHPQRSTSGLEILEEVEDYVEDEETRRRTLEMLTKPPETEGEMGMRKREETEGYPKPGSSHMADLFWATRKKHTPPADEDEEEY